MAGRAVLTLGAAVLLLSGIALLFAADDIAATLLRGAPAGEAALQVAAAGLLGFAATDWMWRANRIGGVYGRPLAIGNLMLFTVAGASLARAVAGGELPFAAAVPALLFVALAAAFGWLAFAHDPLSGSDL